MLMNRSFWGVCCFVCSICIFAQTKSAVQLDDERFQREFQQRFEEFQLEKQQKFEDFRKKANEDYIRYMQKTWEPHQSSEPEPLPVIPEPPKPIVKKDTLPPITNRLEAKVKGIPVLHAMPKPQIPELNAQQPKEIPTFTFLFYNTPCKVRQVERFTMANASEQEAQKAWRFMSEQAYWKLADDCLALREDLALNDWGYVEMLRVLCESYCKGATNEAVMMQMFLLVQSGYKARMAFAMGKMALLMSFVDDIYGYGFLTLEGERYYILDKTLKGATFAVYNQEFPEEQEASLQMFSQPKFVYKETMARTYMSERYPEIKVTVQPNKNLMDFYNDYPVTNQWNYYVWTSLSDKVKKQLYPVLREHIQGKSQQEAANMLINFVQTAFDYQTDDEQFGYERPLFADEMFYYPFADCEDRSILFAVLVRDLLHLDVVLLNYTNHVATAVRFTEDIPGYYYTVDGNKYLVCDPTFIGAKIGNCMLEYRNANAEIVRTDYYMN